MFSFSFSKYSNKSVIQMVQDIKIYTFAAGKNIEEISSQTLSNFYLLWIKNLRFKSELRGFLFKSQQTNDIYKFETHAKAILTTLLSTRHIKMITVLKPMSLFTLYTICQKM